MALGCPESVSGHDVGKDGRCVWCSKRVDPPVPPPEHGWGPTDLDDAYQRFYDPDWGSNVHDRDV